jgi:hypothetical protein
MRGIIINIIQLIVELGKGNLLYSCLKNMANPSQIKREST